MVIADNMLSAPSRARSLSFIGPIVLHLILLPLVSTQTPLPPVDFDQKSVPSLSEECTRKIHPVTSYTALRPWMFSFSAPGVHDYSPLTLDLTRNQLIVGARNHLFRLSLSNISLLQATEWGVEENTRRSCRSKGKTEDECQNYIRVLLLNGSRLFTCGTNAFMPICTTRPVMDIGSVQESISGVARCPFDPRHNSTAIITESGEVYAATVTDFSSRDPIVYRSLGKMPPLRSAQYNSKWLNEPHFVSAYEVGRFTYLFLREIAVEQDCGKTVFSRVARVCQNDIGGRFLLEDTWTTFMKARLNCSRSGDIPFLYQELQSTFFLPEQDLIYGAFTTNVNSIAASAVCAFNLSAITQAFNGPFRYQENPRSSWQSTTNPIPNFQCGTVNDSGAGVNLTERSLQDAQRLLLMSEVVQPVSVDPLLMSDGMRFSRLVVDIVQGRDALYHVLYIATERGTIIKALSTNNKSLHGCVLEEMNILPTNTHEPILSLQILHSDRSLFVGLKSSVLKIPLERCSSYDTEQDCLGARDPYCGWDHKENRCTTIEDSSNMSQWSQDITKCPERNLTEDGGFSHWSAWQPCNHDDSGEGSSTCHCRTRSCDSPRPHCGGAKCVGANIEVANCSRNGGWTPWSSWAECSTSCGIGFEVRQRSCNNPSPRHGGRVCVGQAREERLCNEKMPCPVPVSWVTWSAWSKCSVACGGGVQSRVRSCENGNTCPGCPLEYKACNLENCPEVRRTTPWTPWFPVNVTQEGARQEQRVRFTCRALIADPQELQLGRRKTETRLCPGAQTCESDGLVEDLLRMGRPVIKVQGASWASWETWSACNKECSRGFRTRKRFCATPDGKSTPFACSGAPVEVIGHAGHPGQSVLLPVVEGTISAPVPALTQHQLIPETFALACTQKRRSVTPTSVKVVGGHGQSGRTVMRRGCSSELCSQKDRRGTQTVETNIVSSAAGFSLFHLVLTGACCFLGAVLLSLLVYVYCQKLRKPPQESAVIHPSTPNHLHYKDNSCAPKNDLYTPMEFKTLNKNNLLPPDESCNFFPTPLPQSNVYTSTYYPSPLGKYDFPGMDSPCSYMHS
ncbi:hypothetical protein DNTS_010266 [Danionella cerebrum]|uniref:Semaphorin-5A n=1 Tax=Danionella cerebrum TaxID=2873325 RepID=A0A553R976_9TELE|nr:hypothetical protein DNTS_010266 [Danionella translucida]